MNGLLDPQPLEITRKEWIRLADGLELDAAAATPQARALLPRELDHLLVELHSALEPDRRALMKARAKRQKAWDAGEVIGYLPPEEHPEAHTDWKVTPLPADLLKRRVEITGPVSNAKMVINMLSRNSDGLRADAAMLDFEDSMKPSWGNVIAGFENVIGAARGDLSYTQFNANGTEKVYRLDPADMPLVMVRVRGLHLTESNVRIDGSPIAAGLFDFAVTAFHTAKVLLAQGKTPKFYLPKIEHYLEARWWNRAFELVQQALGLPFGTFRLTALIETLPAAFQMEEILFEMRTHAAGLNGGRWDKIFSDIKVLRHHPACILADRATISVDNRPWMRNYVLQLIKVCHTHGAFGMGGMAAFTPGKTPERRAEQTAKVVADKQFEASIGHDGCWVSHPYFIGPALGPFMRDNQMDVIPELPPQPDLLPKGTGPRTLAGLRKNVRVGIAYTQGWLQDIGCVAWDDLMEDLATLEISRAQTWQWLHHAITLEGGEVVTRDLVQATFKEEAERIAAELHADGHPEALIRTFIDAAQVAEAIFLETTMRPFLTCVSERESDRIARKFSLQDAHC